MVVARNCTVTLLQCGATDDLGFRGAQSVGSRQLLVRVLTLLQQMRQLADSKCSVAVRHFGHVGISSPPEVISTAEDRRTPPSPPQLPAERAPGNALLKAIGQLQLLPIEIM